MYFYLFKIFKNSYFIKTSIKIEKCGQNTINLGIFENKGDWTIKKKKGSIKSSRNKVTIHTIQLIASATAIDVIHSRLNFNIYNFIFHLCPNFGIVLDETDLN